MAEGSPWGRPEGEAEKVEGASSDDAAPSAAGAVTDAASDVTATDAIEAVDPAEASPDSQPAEASGPSAHEATNAAEAESDSERGTEPTSPVAAVSKDGSGSAVIAILGLMLLVLGALVVGLVVYATRDTEEDYPANLANDQYDLASMALRQVDTPLGLTLAGTVEFNNEEWAALLDEVDPEARLPQLDAQQRVRNHISIFGWEDGGTLHLAQTLSVLSQSTLYETEDAAREAITGSALCGLRLNESAPLDEFEVPTIGEESVGFFVTETDEQIGKSVETVVCFRTGRIVHGVVQSALDGAQDIGLVVNMAQAMLTQVDNTFEGTPDPLDEPPAEGG